MSGDDGMIVVDPHAFRQLWPALAIWLALFLTAGDGWLIMRRAAALHFGRPAEAVIVEKRRRSGRNYVSLKTGTIVSREAVGKSWSSLEPGEAVDVHILGASPFLDDDLGYSRWKSIVFGSAFAALWLWAIARYRFG